MPNGVIAGINGLMQKRKKNIDDLRGKGQKAVASRDKWRRRAEIAERKQNEQPQNKALKKTIYKG